MCSHLVRELVKCHDDNPVTKFFGACNDAKYAMDSCFKAEKIKKRDANFAKAREEKVKFEERRAKH